MTEFLDKVKNERILIAGFASKTGLAVAEFLADKDIKFSVSDLKSDDKINKLISKLSKKPVQTFVGEQESNQLNQLDRIVIAPGVPRTIPLIQAAIKMNIPVDSEIAFSASCIINKKIILIGITGTDGKSTTAALTHHIINGKYNSYLLGNFGDPFISKIDTLNNDDYVVLELSSYQLEDGEKYHLNGSTILNIASDHLNRYSSLESYRKAKEKIFINQIETDVAVLNKDLPFYNQWKTNTRARTVSISLKEKADIYFHNQWIVKEGKKLIHQDEIPLIGSHNIENVMIAVGFALFYNVEDRIVINRIRKFKGLEHRTEYLGEFHGIHFINDSKATTIQAVIRSLTSSSQSIILILGGSDKNLDFRELNPYLNSKIKKIICYGDTKEKIYKALNFKDKVMIYDFDKAIEYAIQFAEQNDTILLSPACASFDQFNSFEERGKRFKELVKEYAQKSI